MRLFIVVAAIIAGVVLTVGVAFAHGNSHGDTRPGWGFGDKNHVHTGPPGHSVRPHHDNDDQGENENENHGHHGHHHNNDEQGKEGNED